MSEPVRVGVNLLWLVAGEVGGSETFALGTLAALADRPEVELVVYCTAGLLDDRPEIAEHEVVVVDLDNRRRVRRVVAEATWLASRHRRDRLDLVHHLGGTLPAVAPGFTVLTLYDLQPLDRPEAFSRSKQRYLAAQLPRSLRAAAVVTTLTNGVRDQVVDRFDLDPTRVVVVPPAVAPRRPAEPAGRARQPIVLYPAIPYEHKNHITLLRAFAIARARRPELRLVLTGGPGPLDNDLAVAVTDLGLEGSVERPGRVSEAELTDLYTTAAVLAFPSRYEGFGLPVVEAMASDCPVVAADASVLPEVVGDAGMLVDPDDVTGWARALLALASESGPANAYRAAGRRRAERWAPAAVARQWIDLYRRLGSR